MNMLCMPSTAILLAIAGMITLGLAMDRHYQQLTGKYEIPKAMRVGLRSLGVLLLAASLWCCVVQWDATVGAAVWCGMLTAGMLMAALLFSYAPKLAPWSVALLSGYGVVVLINSAL